MNDRQFGGRFYLNYSEIEVAFPNLPKGEGMADKALNHKGDPSGSISRRVK